MTAPLCPTCGCASLLDGRCVLPWCPSWGSEDGPETLSGASEGEGLKTAQTALYGAHSDSEDPTEEGSHP